ncbi:methionyl-tRNA formyltransferase [Winogradskyella sp.]|nr:methionyl-tRNA formyltransferase [Winogradskyella sp.]
MTALRIVFMGTPEFAVGVLEKIAEGPHEICGVVTAADKPAGRGRRMHSSAVKTFALAHDFRLFQPNNLKAPEFVEALRQLAADVFVVVAFRMLPKVVWQLSAKGTFNVHASLLPHYRGAAPINWAIINGAQQTGVTTFFIDEKIDTGAIIASKSIPINSRETFGSLHDKLKDLGSILAQETLDIIALGQITPQAQSTTEELIEAPKLSAANTQIDWHQDTEVVDALIRGLNPSPGAWSEMHHKGTVIICKIYAASPVENAHKGIPGSITATKSELLIATGNGQLNILELQLPNKKKMTIKNLLNGFSFDSENKFL